ncbi:MAG: insulinase family protein [Clostridium sp.]
MELKINDSYHGFKLLREENVKECKSIARIFEHEKSGARLLNLANDDDNKLFSIGFRTTPTDSTGVAHILEHSVLCGSKKFKTKDPFGDMYKSSLNTFLNAMTFTDKTIYPVSSRNHKDFMNLMNVYLDAVLYPRIYENHEILRQEGWRYDLDEKTNKLCYKGVVYSEMQGALSSPEEVICSDIYRSVFPNTTYQFVSGGAPEDIPNLNQKDFEEFHQKYYHPTNSYIFLYGDQNLEDCLKFINEEYLSNFNRIEIPSSIESVKPFANMSEIISEYSIGNEDDDKNKSFLALNFVFGETKNPKDYLTKEILYNMLIESSASPIKEALLKYNLGECTITIDEMNMDPTKQILFPIVVKNADGKRKDEFKKIIIDVLKDIVKNGVDKDLLQASINSIEFMLREADPYKIANKGIYYNGRVLESWVYDGDPLAHVKYEEILNSLKEDISNRYFEKFIEENMVNNSHCSLVILNPKKGLEARKAKMLEQKLEEHKQSLSDEELNRLIERNKNLSEIQVREDTEEEKATIPKLPIDEIDKNVEKIPQEVIKKDGITILNHDIYTNKIAYMNLLFDANVIEEKYIPYLGLLADILGELDTKNKKYSNLVTEIYKNTGGISFENQVYTGINNNKDYQAKFNIKTKVILENIPVALNLINEIITTTKFDDKNRLKQVIQEIKSKHQMGIISRGHVVGMNNIFSKFCSSREYLERVKGSFYYNFICKLEKDFENNADEIKNNLIKIYNTIFNKNNLVISLVGSEEEKNVLISNLDNVLKNIEDNKIAKFNVSKNQSKDVEAIVTSSNVQYVVKGFDFVKFGYKYSGKMRVLAKILDSEYLHKKVRLQGGAYGCYTELNNDGNMAFWSYRDPNILKAIDAYNEAYKFLEETSFNESDMENFIIGTIGSLYTPLTLEQKGEKATANYICNISYDDMQKEKNEILNTTLEDIKTYSQMIKYGMDENNCCVVGNENKINESKNIFKKISKIV